MEMESDNMSAFFHLVYFTEDNYFVIFLYCSIC